jgi:metal-sulfur cluster biosynthetic enzyme
VTLHLRTTGPGCLYVVFFERELRARIEAEPDVASLTLAWDDAWDWTPDAMAPGARAALAERRRALIALVPAGALSRR